MLSTNYLHKLAWRACCAWLIIFALIFNGLIPAGFMPDISRQAGRLFAVTICTGSGPIEITVNKDLHRVDGKQTKSNENQQSHNHIPCIYSLNSTASFDGLGISPVIAFIFLLLGTLALLIQVTVPGSRIYGNASSRSPPIA